MGKERLIAEVPNIVKYIELSIDFKKMLRFLRKVQYQDISIDEMFFKEFVFNIKEYCKGNRISQNIEYTDFIQDNEELKKIYNSLLFRFKLEIYDIHAHYRVVEILESKELFSKYMEYISTKDMKVNFPNFIYKIFKDIFYNSDLKEYDLYKCFIHRNSKILKDLENKLSLKKDVYIEHMVNILDTTYYDIDYQIFRYIIKYKIVPLSFEIGIDSYNDERIIKRSKLEICSNIRSIIDNKVQKDLLYRRLVINEFVNYLINTNMTIIESKLKKDIYNLY